MCVSSAPFIDRGGENGVAPWGGIRVDMCSKELEDFSHMRFSDGICGSSGIDCRCLSRWLLNLSTEVKGRSLILDGRVFHSLGAAILNAL